MYQIKNDIRKRPSFCYVSGEFQLNCTQKSRNISVLNNVGKANFCLMNLFLSGVPRDLTDTVSSGIINDDIRLLCKVRLDPSK